MLQIRPIRGIARYRESLDFYLYTIRRKRQKEQGQDTPVPKHPPGFPFAKEAEIHAAEEAALAIASVLTAAFALKEALRACSPEVPSSAVNRREAVSSMPETVSAEAEPGAPLGRTAVEVRRLAAAQMNATALFAPGSPTSMTPGFCSVRLDQGNVATRFECFILPNDTHLTALTKLSNALNESGSAVKASLETDPVSGRIRLLLTALAPGREHAFTLTDEHGNAVASSGLSVPDIPASDGEYRIDGEEWQLSADNRPRLPDKGLRLAFHGTTRLPAILQTGPDAKALIRAIRGLSAACGFLIRETAAADGYLNPTIGRSLRHILSGYQPASLGFRTDSDGTLLLDEEALASRIRTGFPEVMSSLSGPSGLIPKLSGLIARMESAPAVSLLDRSNKSYNRYANYMASLDRYSQLPSQGLLVNRFM